MWADENVFGLGRVDSRTSDCFIGKCFGHRYCWMAVNRIQTAMYFNGDQQLLNIVPPIELVVLPPLMEYALVD